MDADKGNANALHIIHYHVDVSADGEQGVVDPKEYTLTCEAFSPSARDDWIATISAAAQVEKEGALEVDGDGGGRGAPFSEQPKTSAVAGGAAGEVEFGGFDSDDYGDD